MNAQLAENIKSIRASFAGTFAFLFSGTDTTRQRPATCGLLGAWGMKMGEPCSAPQAHTAPDRASPAGEPKSCCDEQRSVDREARPHREQAKPPLGLCPEPAGQITRVEAAAEYLSDRELPTRESCPLMVARTHRRFDRKTRPPALVTRRRSSPAPLFEVSLKPRRGQRLVRPHAYTPLSFPPTQHAPGASGIEGITGRRDWWTSDLAVGRPHRQDPRRWIVRSQTGNRSHGGAGRTLELHGPFIGRRTDPEPGAGRA
jgi:hypothetical protein